MSRLAIALHYAEELPPAVKSELEQIIATIQAWANISGDSVVPGNLITSGWGEILGQHCARVTGSASVALAEVDFTWTAPSGQDTDYESFAVGITLLDTNLYLTLPGVYLLYGSAQWDLSAVGTYRASQFSVQGIDTLDVDRRAPSAAFTVTNKSLMVLRVSQTLLDINAGKLRVNFGVFQDGAGTHAVSARVNIAKIA